MSKPNLEIDAMGTATIVSAERIPLPDIRKIVRQIGSTLVDYTTPLSPADMPQETLRAIARETSVPITQTGKRLDWHTLLSTGYECVKRPGEPALTETNPSYFHLEGSGYLVALSNNSLILLPEVAPDTEYSTPIRTRGLTRDIVGNKSFGSSHRYSPKINDMATNNSVPELLEQAGLSRLTVTDVESLIRAGERASRDARDYGEMVYDMGFRMDAGLNLSRVIAGRARKEEVSVSKLTHDVDVIRTNAHDASMQAYGSDRFDTGESRLFGRPEVPAFYFVERDQFGNGEASLITNRQHKYN